MTEVYYIKVIHEQIQKLRPLLNKMAEDLKIEAQEPDYMEFIAIENSKIKYYLERVKNILKLYDSYMGATQPYIQNVSGGDIITIKKQIEELKPELQKQIEDLDNEINYPNNVETIPIEDSKIKYYIEQFEWLLKLYDTYIDMIQPYIPYETTKNIITKEYNDFDEDNPEAVVYKSPPLIPPVKKAGRPRKDIKNE